VRGRQQPAAGAAVGARDEERERGGHAGER
jgi:hypothetical protein